MKIHVVFALQSFACRPIPTTHAKHKILELCSRCWGSLLLLLPRPFWQLNASSCKVFFDSWRYRIKAGCQGKSCVRSCILMYFIHKLKCSPRTKGKHCTGEFPHERERESTRSPQLFPGRSWKMAVPHCLSGTEKDSENFANGVWNHSAMVQSDTGLLQCIGGKSLWSHHCTVFFLDSWILKDIWAQSHWK